jgi:hypothetical protein
MVAETVRTENRLEFSWRLELYYSTVLNTLEFSTDYIMMIPESF